MTCIRAYLLWMLSTTSLMYKKAWKTIACLHLGGLPQTLQPRRRDDGISMISKQHARANNPRIEGYDNGEHAEISGSRHTLSGYISFSHLWLAFCPEFPGSVPGKGTVWVALAFHKSFAFSITAGLCNRKLGMCDAPAIELQEYSA